MALIRPGFFVGKVLIIGGGIANFTNVADTFKVSSSFFFFLSSCLSLLVHVSLSYLLLFSIFFYEWQMKVPKIANVFIN